MFKKLLPLIIGGVLLSNGYAGTNVKHDDALSNKQNLQPPRITLTSSKPSALQQRVDTEEKISRIPFGIAFFNPTYILPFYYTGRPYQQIYVGNTPDNQKIMSSEFKAQLSLQFPIWTNIFHVHTSLKVAYTQLSYWQFYAKSQFFRETDYEPEVFLVNNSINNWLFYAGVVHQSNGRGGDLERSWNRVYIDIRFSNRNWLVSLKPWLLIFKSESSDLHNPDIADYLGYGRILLAYKVHNLVFSIMLRNIFASGFSRGAEEFTFSFPLFHHLRGFVQFFSGYGQSLIEYNHYTDSAGIGIALSDWL